MAGNAWVCAGQGAQFIGMGKDLADRFAVCADLFRRADEVLGFKLSDICFTGPEESLTKTSYCQPAIFVVSVACYTTLRELVGRDPAVTGMAGLSLGEWTALHLAGVVGFEETLRILEARGRFMQEACDEQAGAMVSVIGLPLDALRGVCEQSGVEIANLNSEEQTVLSGPRAGIERAEQLARAAGAKKTVLLKVAGAYHSSLMRSAADKLREVLAKVVFRTPGIPVWANVTAQPHGDPDAIRQAMIRQVTSSVLWAGCVNGLKHGGATRYVEFGPGRVLSGLIKRIDSQAETLNIQDVVTLEKTKPVLAG
ncbi:MAG: [acyl-carrier-protein] S-malonyltransferase [Lentisphaerae bacterium RIFOXYA12_FULL_60_10]|nr:MAG: [acyl-carrier-protein] S-malonyltransferase [Lentisphaerae bacterium RIFOXYA12_FULL_60_10]